MTTKEQPGQRSQRMAGPGHKPTGGCIQTNYSTGGPAFQDPTATTAPTWAQSKSWADASWPAVRRTLTTCLGFAHPTPTGRRLDWQGVDIAADGVRLAWRNRGAGYLRYADVTLRKSRPSGAATECDKLRQGRADYLLWTWTTGGELAEWLLVDAGALRPLLRRQWPEKHMPDATFIAIPWQALDRAGALVACSAGVRQALR